MKRGFTLIELMIVVAIIAFLAMVSVPSFTGFLAKAKRTEAYMNLHAMYAAQKAYWAEHGKYSDTLLGEGGVAWKPEGYHGGGKDEKFYYTYGFGQGAEGKNYFTGKLSTASSHLARSHADANSFVMVAAGDITGSGKMDIITINQNNEIKVEQDALGE